MVALPELYVYADRMHAHQPPIPSPDPVRKAVGLTPGRKRILDILAKEQKPLGAYQMIEKIAETTGKRPAPISIYRALDFLLENGLVHRLASCNTYLACRHGHAAEEPIVFLICEKCGSVIEASSVELGAGLTSLAAREHFRPRTRIMEIAGLCHDCASA
ncbi:Fur family transcriptional regulator [Beijerinckia indica]|uniref:Putative ferric uptake regulator, Fur family n=1 Tax=Beijerinckia indica subsp. indica (strain ATCC 9039 / DSM 1715 / NCIMB 8712) TaxID=395963 RepID=B2IBE6_BEII9|nr:transcriptional repressor [Beijerinckia indica]ACB96572.1 putative ferric uptake regulator, Fur family [Beijerinckia indica subsp. indica ATCC 9039]